jgi:hypothetical protein
MSRDRLAGIRAAAIRAVAPTVQRGLGRAGYRVVPSLTLYADDTLLVSYPRSGNTWVRFLLGNLMRPVVSFVNVERVVPDIYLSTDREMRVISRPRVLKSHSAFDPRYKRVIYLVRDPRDVVLSYYDYQRKLRVVPDDFPIEAYVERFIRGELDEFGSWREHVGSWLGARGDSSDFHLVRYEDVVADTHDQVTRLAAFLQRDVSAENVAQAVELSQADRMRRLEVSETEAWRRLEGMRTDLPFIRLGTPGTSRELPQSVSRRIGQAWAATMVRLGYEVEK